MQNGAPAAAHPVSVMEVNVVKVPEDADFNLVRTECSDHKGWNLKCSKKNLSIKVWTKPCPESDFQMIKAHCELDVCSSTVYDVLHDPDYRSTWDRYMLDSKEIGLLNPNNDICYYALRSMPPLMHRDFVLQRSWLDLGDEKFIFNHSVCHEDYPPRKGCVRGTTFLTGYLIRTTGPNSCHVSYITHSDPGGRLPSWLMNKITHHVCPKMIKKLYKACVAYPIWKAQNSAHWRPWSRPDQQCDLVRVDMSKCVPKTYDQNNSQIDESKVRVCNGVGSDRDDDD